MNAAELLALGERLNTLAEGYGPFTIADQLRQAAEILDLLAWAEEVKPMLGLYGDRWGISLGRRHSISSSSLLDTLRRAREESKLLKKLQ